MNIKLSTENLVKLHAVFNLSKMMQYNDPLNLYDTGFENCEGAHIFAYDRKDGKAGYVYMIINNSKTEKTVVDFGKEAEVYLLSADEERSKDMKLNGKVLALGENDTIPEISAEKNVVGKVTLPPVTVGFVVV